jgi:hypothetical protein
VLLAIITILAILAIVAPLKNKSNSDRLSNHYNQRSPIPKNKSNSDRSKQGA